MTVQGLAPALALRGIGLAVGGSVLLSVNDLAIKFLSGGYALHQVILTRSLIAISVIVGAVVLTGTGLGSLRTTRPRAHLLRVSLVMVSNVTYFMGLAALPLANAVAIAFVSPVLVTLLSVLVLREMVGPWRWGAVALGMLGVLVMMRPGAEAFHWAALLVLISAFCYASTHTMTRVMRRTESAFALNFYVQVGFIVVSTTMGLLVGDGRFAGSADPSVAFLLHGWHWPPLVDWPVFLVGGLALAFGGLMISQAYRTCEAALIAPFEYMALPMALVWGLLVFGTWPNVLSLVGMGLILAGGLVAVWRDGVRGRA